MPASKLFTPAVVKKSLQTGASRRFRQLTICVIAALVAIWYCEQNFQPTDELMDAPQQKLSSLMRVDTSGQFHLQGGNHKVPSNLCFYIIPTPELNKWILGNYSHQASRFYMDALNEARAEIWLHRAFESNTMSRFRTLDPNQADVFVIAGYFHVREMLIRKKVLRKEHVLHKDSWIDDFLANRIIDKDRPHLMLVPTWNPTVSRKVWLHPLMKAMVRRGFNVWSVGFERNAAWQSTPMERIIPIPYVVEPPWTRAQILDQRNDVFTKRKENFVFYAGDSRPNAIEWSGCNRFRMLSPLLNITDNMDVRIVTKQTRLDQQEYNNRMATSDYCLILCGDTPSSRSLTSAMIFGCIPIRIGSRLRGLCQAPCKAGFGFPLTGSKYPHLPFPNAIDWDKFPELDEAKFLKNPYQTLKGMINRINLNEKKMLRSIMRGVRLGWIYGWGNPVNSTDFGNVAIYIWESFMLAQLDSK